MTKKEKFIYLAGILDGEGCLNLQHRKGEYRKSTIACCIISNTSKELIDWLHKNFGGYKYLTKREGNRKLQYKLSFRYREIKKIIPKLIPYLRVKKKEAKQSLKIVYQSRRLC